MYIIKCYEKKISALLHYYSELYCLKEKENCFSSRKLLVYSMYLRESNRSHNVYNFKTQK